VSVIYQTIVLLHIAGALASGTVGAWSLVTVAKRLSHFFQLQAHLLAALATFEILTGTTLAVLSPQMTAQSLCANIALYLFAVAFLEALLLQRTVGSVQNTRVLAPVAFSCIVFIVVLSAGL